MTLTVFLAEAGLLDLSLSFLVEIVAFLAMIAILARWVYPRVIAAAEGRQRQIAEQLEAAERARQEAEQRLKDAEARLQEARGQAAEIIEGGNKLAEQMRADGRARAEEDAKRITESARREIEAERQKALDSVRAEVADLVVAATERVIGESLDITRQRQLIERAISELTSDGRGRA
jgi:F-type H+-transporting ATPase subunit b